MNNPHVEDSKAGYPPNPLRRKAAIANLPSSTVVFDSEVDVPAAPVEQFVTLLIADNFAFLVVSVHYKSPRPTSSIRPFHFRMNGSTSSRPFPIHLRIAMSTITSSCSGS